MPILPINPNPVLKTYQNTALPLAAVLANDHEEQVLNFCINQFIQLRYNHNKKILDFWHPRFSEWTCIEVKNTIRSDYIESWNLSLLDIVKKAIDKHLYIYTLVNEFYIPERNQFGREYYPHDILIYGYNKNELITFGYNNKLELSTGVVPDSLFMKAVNSIPNPFFIDFFDFASFNDYPIKIDQIYSYLNDYIQSINSDEKYKFINTENICSYGVEAVSNMFKREKKVFENGGAIDFRNFDCYFEHKRLMQIRMQKVSDILGDNLYNICYKDIKNNALIIRNLALKATRSKKMKVIEDISFRLENNIKQEIALLSDVLTKIR